MPAELFYDVFGGQKFLIFEDENSFYVKNSTFKKNVYYYKVVTNIKNHIFHINIFRLKNFSKILFVIF
jgi:hypothetical protein